MKLFVNVTNVDIICGGKSNGEYYPLSVYGLIKYLMEFETGHTIKCKLKAWWHSNFGLSPSWLFYHFKDLCSSQSIMINGEETKQTVKEYFEEHEYCNQDYNKYCSTVIVKGKEIKLEISLEERRDYAASDILRILY